MLKQDLATCYDFNLESLYSAIDDCNFKFIDSSNLKRFLVKCCIYANDALLIAIIRRLDLDADARLSKREFFDGIQPLENFTRGSLTEMKKAAKKASAKLPSATQNIRRAGTMSGHKRPMTAGYRATSPRKEFDQIIHSNMGSNEKEYLTRNQGYTNGYGTMDFTGGQYSNNKGSRGSAACNRDEINIRPSNRKSKSRSRSPLRGTEVFSRSPRSNRHYEDGLGRDSGRGISHEDRPQQAPAYIQQTKTTQKGTDNEACLDWLHKNCFSEILSIEHTLEERKVAVAKREDFCLEDAYRIFSESTLARLTIQDLVEGFERIGVNCSQSEAQLLMARYDGDDDGKLGFWEFANIFLPVDPNLRDTVERRKPGSYAGGMSHDTRHYLM